MISRHSCNLESISLAGCYMIADDGVLALAEGICTNLMSLNLKECNQISDISLTKLARNMTKVNRVQELMFIVRKFGCLLVCCNRRISESYSRSSKRKEYQSAKVGLVQFNR